MLRLPSLDEHLAAALRRLARGALQETVLLLLSDHGTHGIWYSNEFELGAAEHKLIRELYDKGNLVLTESAAARRTTPPFLSSER